MSPLCLIGSPTMELSLASLNPNGVCDRGAISPLLFVLIMEYLHRILQRLQDDPNFNFHPKCEKLKIINLCFVDDILVCVRGDIGSMKLIMQKMKKNSTTISMYINNPKNKVVLWRSR